MVGCNDGEVFWGQMNPFMMLQIIRAVVRIMRILHCPSLPMASSLIIGHAQRGQPSFYLRFAAFCGCGLPRGILQLFARIAAPRH